VRLYKNEDFMTHPNFEELFQKYLENQCKPEEAEMVLTWLESDGYNREQKELINRVLSAHPEISHAMADALQKRLQKRFDSILHIIEEKENTRGGLRRLSWPRYAAAAILVFIMGSGVYLLYQKKTSTVAVADQKVNTKKDLPPGDNKAILTLADGKQIILDEAKNGNLAEQGNTKVIKLDGQLAYNKTGNSTEILYNTITTPRGGQYRIILSDGSEIWLNAASSLRFPTSFQGNERRVELTGEGYFEIAKDETKLFTVMINTI